MPAVRARIDRFGSPTVAVIGGTIAAYFASNHALAFDATLAKAEGIGVKASTGEVILRSWSNDMNQVTEGAAATKTVTINGRREVVPDNPDTLLIEMLRDDLGLTGTKLVCGA